MMKRLLASLLVLAASGCPSVTVDDGEVGAGAPTVEFDPGNKVIPFPNNLLLDPTTGKVNLPQQCNESPSSTATRAAVNQLDGFSTYKTTLNVTFTEPVDVASLASRVVLVERLRAGKPVDAATAVPVAVVPVVGKAIRYGNTADLTACTDPAMIDQVTFVPTRALNEKSTYTVALLQGIKTANGTDFEPSFTWSVVREPQPVVRIENGNVTLNRTPLNPLIPEDRAQLEGIDLLWKAHRSALTFLGSLGYSSDEVLLAWEFNTQTNTAALDPKVPGTPAANLHYAPMFGNQSLSLLAKARTGVYAQCPAATQTDTTYEDTQCLLRILLGGGVYTTGDALCTAAGCAAIGNVLNSIVLSKQYLSDVPNTLYTGTGSQPLRGPWSDPIKPAVVHDTDNANPLMNHPSTQLSALVLIPAGATPAAGWPVVIYQHGITRSRSDVFGVAGGLTASKFAVVSIDAVNHGSRAVRIAPPSAACPDVSVGIPGPRADLGPDPTVKTECYAPALSPDLAATRDSFRQTALDIQQVAAAVDACGGAVCGPFRVDRRNIFFMGHSLVGGNLGAIAVAESPIIKAAVLNAAGAGWLDIIENTASTAKFQCPLVDALIDAGVLMGDKYNATANTGLCTTDAWKTMPGYRSFAAIGQWLLNPADPANYGQQLATKKFLLQGVVPDEVVPRQMTINLGTLAGRQRGEGSCGTFTDVGPAGGPPNLVFLPSSSVLAQPKDSLFLEYLTVAPGSAECPPGNTYSHGSLLQPAPSVTGAACNPTTGASCDGAFATRRLQTDAGYYFLSNKQ